MERTIVHCDLDTFFVSVERLINSDLIGKPVLIGGSSDRGVVASCSYEARKYGIHSAMPMRLARQLCPEAVLVRGDHDLYSKYSDIVTEIIEDKIPVVEKASIDEHYLDMTGMDRFFGSWQLTQELRKTIIKETGLPISFGFSKNKTVSKIATGEAKPCGERKIDEGTERNFLAPLSIRKIPGIGEKTYPLLRNMGISQILTLQQMDVITMRKVLGENGVSIWNKANGIDNNAVIPFSQQKSMSKETTFEQDTIDMDILRRTMLSMVDELAFDLRRDGRLTSCVTVKLRYSNFDTHTMQTKLPFTSSERVISEKVMQLFEKLYSRRMLIRLIGVKFSNLIAGGYQADLFNDTLEDIRLSEAMDRIRIRYGHDSVLRGFALPNL
ncbi:DNA polymerase IV [Chryseobacterium indologenes]|uniref:DNA polymerase IV n=3 Tax=Chryseobacterium TaxID=59732 RepID=A0A3G6RL08_CHRLC|nr:MULTISPECIES: DNA polymerase IV [Bacteroidota]AZA84560.1 DNA polymerase IV [Chryseobacterium lactis]AZB04948.1 DNA polymerase IV [Chryseobacterium lactis]KMQ64425.1 DNA polymerase IV [Chryseobacterium angstadtii]MBF6643631.1 DNA polymerase IV [Chryseobacterium indologenes]PNW14679.1 DNA polymerase IV [Chryseobacterium lactis]